MSVVASTIESETSSCKRSRPMSTTTLAQQASGVAMVDMVATMKDISKSFKAHPNDLEVAMDILNNHTELTTMQRLDISDYLADPKNLNHAVVFRKLHLSTRKHWLAHRLAEIGHKPARVDEAGEMDIDCDT